MYQDKILVRQLGLQPYEAISQAMHDFTDMRDENSYDEIWLVEHYPVFTQGQAGKAEHILMPGDIPVVQSESWRTGDISWAWTTGDVRFTKPETAQAGRA
ncbi:lipoate-protein ligase B [Salmonella enterica subsp. arizonae]|uniref:Lipoate-protein ligase B n=1 Tax=Salmonella enterica subsp. arizonae TaxID=59203 RepID=A0A379TFE1_SALER|nr:lipoate-protein ligase B [Salmonella enterica subsp. arizonae]